MSVQNTKPVAISFDTFARDIVKGFKGFDKAQAKLSTVVDSTMQRFIDHVAVTIGRDEKACKALQKAVADSQVVIDTVAQGIMEKKTFTEYAQSAARALHFNVPFEASLKNDTDKKLPWSKKGTTTTAKAGKVTSTTRDELDKTLSKALAQARLLGLTEFAADVLDLAIDRLDGFKETILN